MSKLKLSITTALMLATIPLAGISSVSCGRAESSDKDVVAMIPENDSGTDGDGRLTSANSAFGFKLYSELVQAASGKNIFISPASISFALAMTYNGAEAGTREAMARTLGFGSLTLDQVNNDFARFISTLDKADPKVRLEIANSLWAKRDVSFKADFIQRAQTFYGAQVTAVDFGAPSTVSAINSWVREKTNDKIDKIIDSIDPSNVLFLINAIYFKGAWANSFEKASTKDEPFKPASGGQSTVQMMHIGGSYSYLETTKFQAISLPYGKGRTTMCVFLPAPSSSLKDFQQSLTVENWTEWLRRFQKTPGDLGLPRFKLEYEATLNDPLKTLGLGVAFDPGQADFSGMARTTDRLFISSVKHKSFVEVNEEGTEAAASTSVGISATSARVPRERFNMIVDRPFFFAICDTQTGMVLFMGGVNEL